MRPRPLVTASLAALALTACAADGSGSLTAAPSTAATTSAVVTDATGSGPASSPAPASVPDSLRFTATGVGGGSIDMAQYAGRPLVLWFWAPG